VSQPEIAKKITKTPYFGCSRSFMLVPPESSSAVLVMTSKSVSICNRSHARRDTCNEKWCNKNF